MFSTLILAAEAQQSGNPWTLVLIPVMFVFMYFLMIKPQRRRQKEQASLQQALTEGDEVVTTSGLYGFITGFDGDIVWLEIDDNVQIRVALAAIQRRVDTSVTADATEADVAKSSKATDIGEIDKKATK